MIQADNAQASVRKPRHVAVIMDGNGRWAAKRGLPRYEGHAAGADALRRTLTAAGNLGLECLSVYAFSTENWQRPREEVDALMQLLATSIVQECPTLMKNNVRLSAIGEIDRLPQDVRESLYTTIERTSTNTGIRLVLALSYSSRRELTLAMQAIARNILTGDLDPSEVNEAEIESHLYTHNLPAPDLLIRTGGEKRISNFLLWQAAYAELYFTDTQWPDFGEKELKTALADYADRERRFGLTGEQVANEIGTIPL